VSNSVSTYMTNISRDISGNKRLCANLVEALEATDKSLTESLILSRDDNDHHVLRGKILQNRVLLTLLLRNKPD